MFFLCLKYWKFFQIYIFSVYTGKIFLSGSFQRNDLLIFSKSLPGSEMMMLYDCKCVCVGEMFCRKWDRAVSALYHRKLDQPVNKQAQGNKRKLSIWETKANKQLKRSQRSKHIIYLSRLHKQQRINSELLHSSSDW